MQLDVKAVIDGELSFLSGNGFKAALTLMAKSWHETPAASLPDDDRRLAAYCGFGRDAAALTAWAAVRDEALSDFTLCSDGRWYSRTMAPRALEAWESKKAHVDRTAKARQARAENRKAANDHASAATTSVTETVTTSATQSIGDEKRGKEIRSEDGTVAGADGPSTKPSSATYAFEEGIVRLTQSDFDKWQARYPHIRLEAKLASMVQWAERLQKEGKNWFVVFPSRLTKLDDEARTKKDEVRASAEARAKQGAKYTPGQMAI